MFNQTYQSGMCALGIVEAALSQFFSVTEGKLLNTGLQGHESDSDSDSEPLEWSGVGVVASCKCGGPEVSRPCFFFTA